MAYYSGTVASLTELQNALVNSCLLHAGWSFSGTTLSNATLGIYLEITTNSTSILVNGKTSPTGIKTPNACRIGRVFQRTGYPTGDIIFPADYEIFVHDEEVYLIVKHSIDTFQWLAFGSSNMDFSANGGTGMWVSASLAEVVAGSTGVAITGPFYISTTNSGGGSNNPCVSPAMFWWDTGAYLTFRQSFIHSNLDGDGWQLGLGSDTAPMHRVQLPLLDRQPSNWNSEAILLPINVYKTRASSKLSLVLQPQKCRMLRIDHYEPQQIILLGNQKWKVYPWYQKNSDERSGGNRIWHTGTFGWAISYDGP